VPATGWWCSATARFASLRAALTAPERVRGLVLVGTQAGVESPEAAAGYRAGAAAWREHGAEPQAQSWADLLLGPGFAGNRAWIECST
jgi:pimeloyl-ACP methyl ester carboxylesterase